MSVPDGPGPIGSTAPGRQVERPRAETKDGPGPIGSTAPGRQVERPRAEGQDGPGPIGSTAPGRQVERPRAETKDGPGPKRRTARSASGQLYVLVHVGGVLPYVTWAVNEDSGATYWGHYFTDFASAWDDLQERAR